jgi:hypothetical protein
MKIKGEKLDIEDEEFAKGWDPGERWRAQQASCVSAFDLHSGSLLTSSPESLFKGRPHRHFE